MAGNRVPDAMLAKVEPEWRGVIEKFIATAEYPPEFEEHLDNGCDACLTGVNWAYKHDMDALRGVSKIIQQEREEKLKKMGFWKRLLYRITGQL